MYRADLKAGKENLEETLAAEASLFFLLNHILELYLWPNSMLTSAEVILVLLPSFLVRATLVH